MTLKSFVLGIFFKITKICCERPALGIFYQKFTKIWKCSVFAVLFQGIFFKIKFYKKEDNALFLLCFFQAIFFKIKCLQKRRKCSVFAVFFVQGIFLKIKHFQKRRKGSVFAVFFKSTLFKNIFPPLFENLILKKTHQKPSFFLFFAKIWF